MRAHDLRHARERRQVEDVIGPHALERAAHEALRLLDRLSLHGARRVEEEEELWQDDESDHDGWFCVATNPFPCPASGCTFVANYMTAVHLILVWEVRDDPNLLWHAQRAMEVGRNPRVVDYEEPFGPSASYYAWEAAGRPVHGIKGK